MIGRTQRDPGTKKKRVLYVCPTYQAGTSAMRETACGYQRILHTDAEKMLFAKIEEMGLPYEATASQGARANIQAHLEQLGHKDGEYSEQLIRWTCEGIDALVAYLEDTYPDYANDPHANHSQLKKLGVLALDWYHRYWEGSSHYADKPDTHQPLGLPLTLADLRKAVNEVETAVVEGAQKKIEELRKEYASYTKAWAKASDLQQGVLKEEIEKLEAQIRDLEPKTVPLAQRFEALAAAEEKLRRCGCCSSCSSRPLCSARVRPGTR
jgi:hypothetical protein